MTPASAARTHRRGFARMLGGDRTPDRPVEVADRADEPAARRRWFRHLLWPVLAVLLGGAAMLAGGVPAWRAAVIAVCGAVALWAVIVSMAAAQPEWPYDVPLENYRAPAVWEVPGLLGAQESAVSFQTYLRPRLWALAQELLRRRGIEPDSDRAKALVGAREYALLTGADTDPKRCTASVSVLCHTIARLAVQPAAGSRAAIRNPALAGLAGPPGRSGRRVAHRPTEGPRP